MGISKYRFPSSGSSRTIASLDRSSHAAEYSVSAFGAANVVVLRAQDLVHGLTLGELVDELVQVAQPAHRLVLDVFDPDSADHAGDVLGLGLEAGSLAVEGLEVEVRGERLLQARARVPREPADDLVDLGLRPTLRLGLPDVQRIDGSKAHCVDPGF